MIEVRALTKTYGGQLAVNGLSFTAPAGEVTGFPGPNGAGKTNLLAEVAQIVDHVVIIREAARSRASGSPRRGTHDRTTERSGDGAMELPSHPESEGPASGPHPGPTPGGRGTVAVLVVVAALVAVIVILHLTGAVGPGAHGS